ncbi:MAG TPA: NAD(P)H-hydrate dehydratase, partial [Nitrospiria bacterium]|nr:NAD(P)H-hydrate dehydratase [Nitrospiria bacterium]
AKIPAELTEPNRFAPFLQARPRGAHKGFYGHLLIVAGSRGKGGAAAMAAHGALRSGVGLLTVAYPRELLLPNLPMEAMTAPLPESPDGTLSSAALKPLLNGVQGKEAVAIGPGLSQNPETQEIIRELIFGAPLPVVIDADGINALAGKTDGLRSAPGARVLTPHPGEMARLIGTATQKIVDDPMGEAERFATEHRVVLVLKGAQTLIATPDGSLLINPTGNPGMATGGSGDVLTGMIGALLARGVPPPEAAALSVYLHGLAGDLAASDRGETGMTPSDLIDEIPGAFRTLQADLKTASSTKEYK